MLDVIDLDFEYQDQPVLTHISFRLSAGELLHLKGANGAGKTTLLKLIAGLNHPAQGEIRYLGQSIHSDLASYQKQLCFIGHKAGINPYLTVRENCLFDLHYQPHRDSIEELTALFNLNDHLNQPCGLLSAGQRRKVGLLRLWMSDRPLWLLDEPLVALDEHSLAIIMDKIDDHRQKGGAVLLTSHQALPLHHSNYQEYVL